MALVSSGGVVGASGDLLGRARATITALKSALDSRDDWELLAKEHERAAFPKSDWLGNAIPARLGTGGKTGMSSGSGRGCYLFPSSKSDASYNRRRMDRVPTSIPKSLNVAVVWDATIFSGSTLTAGVAVQEDNAFFTFTNHPQQSSWAALFDQYCIVEVRAKYLVKDSPGSVTGTGIFYTALDLDSSANITTVSAIQSFGTCMVHNARPGLTVHRTVRPCVTGTLGSTTLASTTRTWIDCAIPAIPHYCHRLMSDVTTAAAYTITPEYQLVFAFRSNI